LAGRSGAVPERGQRSRNVRRDRLFRYDLRSTGERRFPPPISRSSQRPASCISELYPPEDVAGWGEVAERVAKEPGGSGAEGAGPCYRALVAAVQSVGYLDGRVPLGEPLM
jgi:hypothetical protein